MNNLEPKYSSPISSLYTLTKSVYWSYFTWDSQLLNLKQINRAECFKCDIFNFCLGHIEFHELWNAEMEILQVKR